MLAGGDAERSGRLVPQLAQGGELGLDLLEARADGAQQPLAGFGRRDTARGAGQKPESSRSSRLRMVWLNAEGDTPSLAAARVKLRSRATVAKAARSLKFCMADLLA